MVYMFELIGLLPQWYQYTFIVILGLILGSFLDVVATRFHTGKSINGRSRCLSCGHTLSWFELFPVLSYLILLGRCKQCRSYISVRLLLVELVTAAVFLLIYMQVPLGWLLPLSLLLASVLLVVTIYDINHMVIPNQLVVVTSVLAFVHFMFSYGLVWNREAFVSHAGAALGAFLFYGGLWFVSKGRWIGFGDAKLAIPLGFILGIPAVFSFVVFSFWIGAIVSLCILGFPLLVHTIRSYCSSGLVVNYSRYFTMKSEVPFAPFMILAFLLVYLYHVDVIQLTALFI